MLIKHYFYSSLTDEELVGLLSRDKSAEKEFYRRYRYRILRWMTGVNFWDREDLFQECLIALYEAVQTYKPEMQTRFNTYARVCVQNHMYSYLRRFSSTEETIDPELLEEMNDQREGSERLDDKLLLESFLSTLSPLERRVVVKRFVERKSYTDIATELAISSKKVDNILYKVRLELHRYLKK